MVQVASNLLSVMPARSTGRLSVALANQSTGRGFDQVLEKSSSSGSPKKSEVKKSDKPKDDKSEQAADKKAKKSSDPVEEKKPHEDSQDATDVALAASAVQIDQPVESEQLLAANATQNAPAANQTANTTNPLIQATTENTEQGGAEDQSSKQRNAAEAMLRLLGVATGQGASQQSSALALVDAGASNAVTNVNAPTPAGPVLPMPVQDDGTMDQANLARVSRALQNAVQQKGGTITIRMMPPELGQVRVDIQLHGGKVSASFQTEHPAVGSLMSRELSQLRQALEKQGFTVDKLEVSQRPASGNASNSSQNGSQHQAPSDGRSRGQYMPQSPSSDENHFENNSLENSFETQLDQQSQTL